MLKLLWGSSLLLWVPFIPKDMTHRQQPLPGVAEGCCYVIGHYSHSWGRRSYLVQRAKPGVESASVPCPCWGDYTLLWPHQTGLLP